MIATYLNDLSEAIGLKELSGYELAMGFMTCFGFLYIQFGILRETYSSFKEKSDKYLAKRQENIDTLNRLLDNVSSTQSTQAGRNDIGFFTMLHHNRLQRLHDSFNNLAIVYLVLGIIAVLAHELMLGDHRYILVQSLFAVLLVYSMHKSLQCLKNAQGLDEQLSIYYEKLEPVWWDAVLKRYKKRVETPKTRTDKNS